MRATLKDIAQYTGYSITTISLVLNNKPNKISKEARTKILDAAKELNYHPNQIAVGLVKRRTETIGLIVSDVSNIFFAELAKGVEDECRKKGWNLVLCNTNDKHERDLSYIQMLADKGVDGILFCMSRDSTKKKAEESIRLLKKLKMPFVMIDRHIDGAQNCSIVVDHVQGGYDATNYLLKMGHKKIGCITGPSELEDSVERLKGYKKALNENDILFEKKLICEGQYNRESGAQEVKHLLEQGATAIFAFNDMTAYGVYHQLKYMGLKVPDDISLIGYDDIFFSELLDIPLTTVRQPIYDMGIESVKQLIYEIESGNTLNKRIVFQPKLIVRNSVCEYS